MNLFMQCIIFCILFTIIILPAQYKDPLSMIMSYPPKIIKRVEQLPQYKGKIKKREKSHLLKKLFGLVFFVVILSGVAFYSGCRDFMSTFLHVFTLFLVVNVYDLIVLDWGIFCHSKKLRIQGTEDMDKEYTDKFFHVKGAIVGTILGMIVALLSGCIVYFVLAM